MIKYKYFSLISLFICVIALTSCANNEKTPPNIVIIFLDDSGWGDFRPFGAPDYQTPNIDQLAKEGRSFTQFYVPQAVCSASRAALLTGCYPGRTKVFGAIGPTSRGLDPKFPLINEILKENGYKSAIFGKWHLGDQPETRPPARGFDESAGLMYSNDMWEFHPENPEYWGQWPLQYYENGKPTILRVTGNEQAMLTTWYTEKAVDFINRNTSNSFFLYVPHSMPHVPLFCSDKFKGKSGHGLYADVMMEIDWSVGKIMESIKSNNLEENTMVIFTSDNGPWISYGNHAGKTPYREAKGTSFDGGTRSGLIIKYPRKIKPNTISNNTFCSIDLFPTLVALTGSELPSAEIDGKNVWNLISGGPKEKNPHEYYAFTTGNKFQSLISGDGKWKLHLPHNYRTLREAGKDGMAGIYEIEKIPLSLFDMENDPYEHKNVIEEHPEIAKQLLNKAEQHKNRFYSE